MTVNKKISVYRYDDYDNNYKCTFCGEVSFYNDFKVAAENGGLKPDNVIKIRIPTAERLDIRLGDHVIIGDMPLNRDIALKIIDISDNRRGTNPHYRIHAV